MPANPSQHALMERALEVGVPARSFQPSLKTRIGVEVLDGAERAEWMACLAMMPNQTSTRFEL